MGFDWVPLKNYKRHFICLSCQKGFKRPSEKDMKHAHAPDFSNLMSEYYASGQEHDIVTYIQTAHQKAQVVCPQCQGPMLQVHYNFEVPPHRDNRAWKRLQKTMHADTVLKFDTYIQWHRLAIQRAAKGSPELASFTQNLAKLIARL